MNSYFDIGIDEIEKIRNLWEANRIYHVNTSKYFSKDYQSINFDDRMKILFGLDKDTVKITIAAEGNNYTGYCISKIVNGIGEILSIHVLETSRGTGIGKELANKHLNWMKEKHCTEIGVSVSYENESTISFYRSLGFFPNTLSMKYS